MRLHLLVGLALVVPPASAAIAETVTIEHAAVACVVAEKFPQFQARFVPGDSVAKAKVLFQPEGTGHWYAVAMTPQGSGFSGVLPRPKKSLKGFRYYIELTDRALGTSRTAEYSTLVAAGPGACRDKAMAIAVGSASVVLEAPAGAASVPAGFSSTGVTAASGAAGSGALVGAAAGGGIPAIAVIAAAVAGAAAAGAAVVVTTRSSDEGSNSPDDRTQTPSPAPPVSYSGPWATQWTLTNTTGSVVCSYTRALSGTVTLTIQQSSGAVTGSGRIVVAEVDISRAGPSGCDAGGGTLAADWACTVMGTVNDLSCTAQTTSSRTGEFTVVNRLSFSGAFTGNVISGTLALSVTGDGTNPSGSTSTFRASTSFPVTLQ